MFVWRWQTRWRKACGEIDLALVLARFVGRWLRRPLRTSLVRTDLLAASRQAVDRYGCFQRPPNGLVQGNYRTVF